MRPPACTQCKWGPGTACERPTNTGASKELEKKLKEMAAERAKQDSAWFAVPTASKPEETKKPSVK